MLRSPRVEMSSRAMAASDSASMSFCIKSRISLFKIAASFSRFNSKSLSEISDASRRKSQGMVLGHHFMDSPLCLGTQPVTYILGNEFPQVEK